MMSVTEKLRANGREFRKGVLATPSVVSGLRDLTEAHLHSWGLSEHVDIATLVVSELVTNAVKASFGSLIGFQVVHLPDALVIEVWDPSESPPKKQCPRPTDTRGRGLSIVEAVAQAWGVREDPPETGGKTVWAALALGCQGNPSPLPQVPEASDAPNGEDLS
ncbi:ATP-binding protein [Actinomadura rudentiformis]|uniref:ATP-binding protein n=1 Tax=Actinomadura rudentiformis TaxID=359158 RepID=A0A6H9YLH7_9ACTN|nr:ATP-binding protein [Actinomadura rudentiformis]KAB2339210.1 ATP-binding protein [Actinomadura rudentiformis]